MSAHRRRIARNRFRRPQLSRPRFSFTKPNLIAFLPWLPSLLTLFLLLLILYHPLFHLRHLNCSFDLNQPCPLVIIRDLEHYLSKPTLRLNPTDLKTKYLNLIPEVEAVELAILFPHTLNINFSTTQPIAAVMTAPDSPALLISSSHIAQSVVDELPPGTYLIIYPEAYRISLGDAIEDPALKFALQLGSSLEASSISLKDIEIISQDTILANLEMGSVAIFTSLIDLDRQLTSLQLILSKATIDPGYRFIDVRFDEPVLRRTL